MIKNILLFAGLLISFLQVSFSQEKRQSSDFQGEITGRIIDNTSEKPMEYANVSVFSMRDSALAGGSITNSKGYFKIEKLKPGFYKIKVDFIGYERYIHTAKVNPQNPLANIGTIKLKPAITQLSEVEVISEKPLVEFSLDKKVINVDKNIVTAGGSATDILRNTPAVSVDMDGNVSLRGSTNVTILVDGKPSMLSGGDKAAILEQIPASTIQTIELITNPSAKYDPEGMAGIINIKTKKEKNNGTNGLITLNYGTWEKYGASINLNRKTGSFNFFLNYDYKNEDRKNFRSHERTFLNNDTVLSYYNIISNRLRQSQFHTVKGGLDYSINPMNNFIFSATCRTGVRPVKNNTNYEIYDNIHVLTSDFDRLETSDKSNNNIDLSLGYKKQFEQKGRELTADAYYSKSDDDELTNYKQIDTIEQHLKEVSIFSNFTIQSDYSHPINEKTKVEAGVKYMLRTTDDDYHFLNYDPVIVDFKDDTNLSNRFIYSDQVFASYTTFSKEWKKFNFQAGLRAEQTYQNGDQKTMQEKYYNDYFSFFPSVHTSYSLPKENKLQISYSRRINRPSIQSMNPFVDASDPYTHHTGNPYLKPEYINSYELGHIKDWKKISLTSSVFFKQTNDVISRYRITDTSGVVTVTRINVAKAQSYGVDFIVSSQPVKFIRLTADFSWFKTTLEGSNLETDLTSSIYSYNGKLNASIFLPKNFSIQINCILEGPSVMAQNIRQAFYLVNGGIRKDLWNKKASVSLRVSDIFNTMHFKVTTDDSALKATMQFKRETQIVYITFSYRINEGIKQKERNYQQDIPKDIDIGE